jgi:hypothetical protein
MWVSLISGVLGFIGKVFPFVGAYFAGKSSAQKEELEEVVEDVLEAKETEQAVDRLERGAAYNELLQRWRKNGGM